jgi:cytochrome c-type biogenesis protein CcmH/NrfG
MSITPTIVKRTLALCIAFASVCAVTLTATPASASLAPPDQVDFSSTLQAARAAYEHQDYHLAAGLYERVVKGNPVNPAYWRALAAAHYLAGEYREAIPAYRTALELRQDQPRSSPTACVPSRSCTPLASRTLTIAFHFT